ncbi:MAG: ATP-grasp domain-containing protein [Phycisphaerales bacterium]
MSKERLRIGYVSCLELPEPDIDEKPLVEAIEGAGHEAVVVAWDDPDVDWGSLDVAVVRATWNYAHAVEAFSAWIDRVDGQTKLLNDASTLKWNLDKRYLLELEEKGVEIVPTAFFERGERKSVGDVAGSRGWGKIVIKPTVSAGSFGTRVFDLVGGELDQAQMFFDEMIARRGMMVQVFMDSVDTVGETAIVVIDGAISHAIEKRPRFDDQDEEVYLRETIDDEMRDVAERVLEAAGRETLYARVDVMPGVDGSLVLSELELLEPSLFFPQFPEARGALVRGIVKRA